MDLRLQVFLKSTIPTPKSNRWPESLFGGHAFVVDLGFPRCGEPIPEGTDLLLPPANEVAEDYVFTPVCHSVHRGMCLSLGLGRMSASGSKGCLPLGLGVSATGSGGVHPQGRYPLGRQPQADTPKHTPPRQTYPCWTDNLPPPTKEMTIEAHSIHPTGMHSCYHPQTKFSKIMFLHLSVSHSVHRVGGTWAGTPPGRYTPRQVHPRGRYTPSPLCRYTPLGRYTPWGAVHGGRYGQQAGGTECILVWDNFCHKLHENEKNGLGRVLCIA